MNVLHQRPEGTRTYEFDTLSTSDLIVDAIYRGGSAGNASDDPLSRLIGGGNQGGFRYVGSPRQQTVKLCVLYSDLSDADWPDRLYPENGIFTYYGDNKRPGHELHSTPRDGNLILRDTFAALHAGQRDRIPPFFVFTRAGAGRDVQFRGLAVPGAQDIPQTDDLVAIWKSSNGLRFQNYRATFTILSTAAIRRDWLTAIKNGDTRGAAAPAAWRDWLDSGRYDALTAEPTRRFRTRSEQLPSEGDRAAILATIVRYFKAHPQREFAFESCAATLLRIMDPNFATIDLTRPWRDGGRDAVGQYRIGIGDTTSLSVEFAMEAKCKTPAPNNSSGVKETSRLISRLRHRQFGVFVTTSCIHEQAYRELTDDAHPVLVLSGSDIVEILTRAGRATVRAVETWLHDQWPYVT